MKQISIQYLFEGMQGVRRAYNNNKKKSRMFLRNSLLFLAVLIFVNGSQYVPIPAVPQGIAYGNPSGKIQIELIYDPMCYDTQNFDVNVTRKLEKELDPKVLGEVYWRVVGQAKPWHFTALKILQGIKYVHDKKSPEKALACFRYFLDNIPSWDNTRMQNQTVASYMDRLAQKFEELAGVTASQVRPQLQHYSDYDSLARIEYKHTIGNRHCGANPSIYVNGAKVDNGMNKSLSEWKELLGDLLK